VRKIITICLIILAMTLTFIALGVAMFYLTGAAEDLNQIWDIVTGESHG
tara:strand:+ start:5240 stop:5386 length:147 start_codon:yes stop_codon:yes gene_type:complete